jgi:hypothetical protein
MYRPRFPLVLVTYGKYQEIPTNTNRKIPIRYNSRRITPLRRKIGLVLGKINTLFAPAHPAHRRLFCCRRCRLLYHCHCTPLPHHRHPRHRHHREAHPWRVVLVAVIDVPSSALASAFLLLLSPLPFPSLLLFPLLLPLPLPLFLPGPF